VDAKDTVALAALLQHERAQRLRHAYRFRVVALHRKAQCDAYTPL
jgi:hypothetical protein